MTDRPGIDLLDDPELIVRSDRASVLLTLARSGAQVRSVAEQTADLLVDPPRGVLVVGPTAARDTGLLTAIAGPGTAPVLAMDLTGADFPTLPSWVGALDLVVVLAGDPEDGPAAEVAFQSGHRGAGLVVRTAAVGPVADAAGAAAVSPAIGAPELLAGAGRIALLVRVAAAAGLIPPIDLDAVAAALDAESLACGPAAETFTNPAVALARRLWGAVPVLVGSDPVGIAVADLGAASLALLGGSPAAALSGAQVLRAPQLVARAGAPVDPFADPFLDHDDGSGAPPVPVLIAPEAEAGDRAGGLHRALERALPRAFVIADDIPEELRRGDDGPSGTQGPAEEEGGGGPAAPPRQPDLALTRRVAGALRLVLRLDYAAAYLGIAAGQLTPIDAPAGLGPAGSTVPSARPTTVDDMPGDDRRSTPDPWDEATWN